MDLKLLTIKNLTKHYRSGGKVVRALDGVSLDIYQGEVLGLLGVNGAGKTTLSSIIATFNPATSGEIFYDGKSIYDDVFAYRTLIGYCPQKPNLDSLLTVKENLIFAGRYYLQPEAVIEERATRLMKNLALTRYADFKISKLSGGYKQRVSIARALMNEPKLVIFDEPTVALDPHIRREIWEIIKTLKDQNIAVLLTTHYLDEAEVLSDRVCILERGKIQIIDTPENLKNSYAKGNLEEVFLQMMNVDDSESFDEDK